MIDVTLGRQRNSICPRKVEVVKQIHKGLHPSPEPPYHHEELSGGINQYLDFEEATFKGRLQSAPIATYNQKEPRIRQCSSLSGEYAQGRQLPRLPHKSGGIRKSNKFATAFREENYEGESPEYQSNTKSAVTLQKLKEKRHKVPDAA